MIFGLRINQLMFLVGSLGIAIALGIGGTFGFFILIGSQGILLAGVGAVLLNK
jgi:hypothetical protein